MGLNKIPTGSLPVTVRVVVNPIIFIPAGHYKLTLTLWHLSPLPLGACPLRTFRDTYRGEGVVSRPVIGQRVEATILSPGDVTCYNRITPPPTKHTERWYATVLCFVHVMDIILAEV